MRKVCETFFYKVEIRLSERVGMFFQSTLYTAVVDNFFS